MKNKKDAKRTMTAILVAALCLGLSQTPALVQSAYAADTSTSGTTEPGGGETAGEGDADGEDEDGVEPEGEGDPEDGDDTEPKGEGEPEDGDDTDPKGEGEPEDGDDTEPKGEGEAEDGDDTEPKGEGEPKPEDGDDPKGEDGILPANGDTENPEQPPIVETVENPVATISDTQYETFADALANAKTGDTITLQQDLTLENGYTIPSTIEELTLDLNGHIVDGQESHRFLLYRVKGNLTIENGTIQNCSGGTGAAIYTQASVTLNDVTFEGCVATIGGGVLQIDSNREAVCQVTNCHFLNNTAKNGGVLKFETIGKIQIEKSEFSGNNATHSGGAIVIHNSKSVIANSTFINNSAPFGGAISASESELTVTDGSFIGNSASNPGGGAIYIAGISATNAKGILNVENVTFEKNEAPWGSAIFGSFLGDSKIEGSILTENEGNAVYLKQIDHMDISNTKIAKNTTSKNGTMYIEQADVAINDCEIVENTSEKSGGAMYIKQADVAINDGEITGNTATFGGAVMNDASALTLQDGAALHNNGATKQGDDIYANAQATLTLISAADAVLTADGKAITGWYVDGLNGEGTTNRWGAANEEDGVPFFEKVSIEETLTGNLALKAAHGRYFTVAYTDGVADSEIFADQAFEVEDGAETPKFDGTPAREGFTFKGWDKEIAETVTGDAVYTAVWEEIQTTPDPEEPTPPTSGGGYIPRPRPTTPPTTEITEPDVPLVETPEVTPEVPEVEVPDVQPPLDEAPAETEVEEEEVPLADVPKTGDAGSLPLAASLTASLAGIAGFVRKLRREK
ncbi:MAG: hypothetical protein HFE45_03390 [Oscillospiraceae bacterium]|jgi:predicted outer membrane repeat protein|nr:hypothetical protein [Oscillospiraceae bacterium]